MKIYIGHSKDFDYINELYKPLRASELNTLAEIILPHEHEGQYFNSKVELKNIDLMVAEVSHPATGLGIEMGYADIYQTPLIIAYKTGSKVSGSAKALAKSAIEYADAADLIQKLTEYVKAR